MGQSSLFPPRLDRNHRQLVKNQLQSVEGSQQGQLVITPVVDATATKTTMGG